METTNKPAQETAAPEKGKEKMSFGKRFMNFLMYGGFIVVLILAVVVVILVEKLFKWQPLLDLGVNFLPQPDGTAHGQKDFILDWTFGILWKNCRRPMAWI
jgi:hypothetical protein